MIAFGKDGVSVGVLDSDGPSVIRRDTNTVVVEMSADETVRLIAELSARLRDSREIGQDAVTLVIEQDEITFPRRVFE